MALCSILHGKSVKPNFVKNIFNWEVKCIILDAHLHNVIVEQKYIIYFVEIILQ